MRIRTVAASAGLGWVRDGAQLFARQPFALSALSAFYLLLVLFPTSAQPIGLAVSGIASPFAAIGMMEACRDTERGRRPTPMAFAVAMLSDPPRAQMLRLGVIHATILLLAWLGMALAGIDAPIRITQPDGAEAPAFEVDQVHLMLQYLGFLPLEMAMWFAPVFIGWHRVPALKAMFFSLYTCWKNRWAMLLYVFAATLLVGGAAVGILALIAMLGASPVLLSFLTAPLMLVGAGFVQATLYPIYRAIVVTE